MSLHYGEGKTKEVDRVRNMAYRNSVGAGTCLYADPLYDQI